jgi:hypothetical protein
MYNIKDDIVEKMIRNTIHDAFDAYADERDTCKLFWYMDDDEYYYEENTPCGEYVGSGVSKLVFDFPHDVPDYVFKLPFQGECVLEYDDNDEICDEEYWEFGYVYKGTKDYLQALDIPENDHCAWEVFLYEEAKKAGVEEFFTEVNLFTMVGHNHPYPIYISPKVEETWECCDEDSKTTSKESRDKAIEMQKHNDIIFYDYNILAALIDQTSYEKVCNLLNFMRKFDISDLHSGNIGIDKNGKIVIIDYAGYGGF